MLRPRGPCGLEDKSFGLGLTLSGLGLDLDLMASGLGLIEIGLVASNTSLLDDWWSAFCACQPAQLQ